MKKTNTQKGYTVLILVLVVAAGVLAIVLALSSQGLNETLISADDQTGERSFQIAEACIDEAVIRLSREFNGEEAAYTGGTLNFGSDSCTITITDLGTSRQVDVVSTVNTKINRKIRAVVQMTPTFELTSWQEQQ